MGLLIRRPGLGCFLVAGIPLPRQFLPHGLGLALALFICVPGLAQQTANIEGRVLTDHGVTVKTATVRLETDDGELVADQPVSTAGDFYFRFIPKKSYQLVVTADGFQQYKEHVNLGEGAGDYNVNVSLTPVGKGPMVKQTPSLTDTQAPSEARREYSKGVKAIESHKLGDARKQLELAVGKYPCYARAQTDLATVLSDQKDFKGAEDALRKSIGCDPGYVDAHLKLGALLNAERKFGEADTILEQGARQAPASWQFCYQIGIAQYGLKNYEAAEQEYNKVASLTPDPPAELKAKLADVYLKESQYAKAYAAMEDYLKADPGGRFAPRVKEIMKQMQSSGVLKSQSTPPSFGPQ
jgi:tetratricopeptide (TPR) repeat protein